MAAPTAREPGGGAARFLATRIRSVVNRWTDARTGRCFPAEAAGHTEQPGDTPEARCLLPPMPARPTSRALQCTAANLGRRLGMHSLLLACLLVTPFSQQPAVAPPPAQSDPIAALLQSVKDALTAGRPDAYLTLVSPPARPAARSFATVYFGSPAARAIVRERERVPAFGVPEGDGYELIVEVFAEAGPRARLATWRLDVARRPLAGRDSYWSIVGQQPLSTLDGLYRLALDPSRQYAARNVSFVAEDFERRVRDGAVFVANAEGEPTALVVVGDATMRFAPPSATERGQLKIFAGSETLESRVTGCFIRLNPADLENHVKGELVPARVEPGLLRRADAIFREESARSFGLDIDDLSPGPWSLIPTYGDVLAEIRTRDFETLTYARAGSDPEDINLFSRKRQKNISLYSSRAKLATGARFYSEDDQADYDVLDYDIDVGFAPDHSALAGRARVTLRTRTPALTNFQLRLAESLKVQSIFSRRFGPLMTVRPRHQNTVLVSLPTAVPPDTVITLYVTYAGQVTPQDIDREAVSVGQGPPRDPQFPELGPLPGQPSYLYSNRTAWYPQAIVTDYATATLRVTVPAEYTCVASGALTSVAPVAASPVQGRPQPAGRQYVFVATQPLRYLSFLVTRLLPVQASVVALDRETAQPETAATDGEPRAGVYYHGLEFDAQANPRQQVRARAIAARAVDMLRFYTYLAGDCPFPAFTLAVLEDELPGGHSPGYLGIVVQQAAGSSLVWRDDPVSFPDFPEYFLAHEIAHQWWGQAVGWANYHEQWLSEGLAQYFAALYAERLRGHAVFDDMIHRMGDWALKDTNAGPVYLGYRIGHLGRDNRAYRAIVYDKGAMALHMLRRLIGDEAFFAGMKRFYAASRFRKAGSEDLRAAFEAAAHRPLDRFFDRWIYNAAVPRLAFSWETVSGPAGNELVVRFRQLGDPFDVPVTVTVEYADREPVEVVVPITEPVTVHRIPLAGRLRRVSANRDGAALAIITNERAGGTE